MIGRDRDLRVIEQALEAGATRAVSICVSGEAGIGKTQLWDEALTRAADSGTRILTTRSSSVESNYSFVGLVDLFAEVGDDELAGLPPAQGRALMAALLRSDEAEPADNVIARAFLGAVRALAADRPLVIAVDDVQWLDGSTATLLAFAYRRLRTEPVTLVLTARDGEPAGDAAAALIDAADVDVHLGPLSADDIGGIVKNRNPDLPTADIVALAGGNPFFAVELSAEFSRQADASSGAISVPRTLRTLLASRLAAISPDARDAILATYALSRPTRAQVVAASLGQPAHAGVDLALDTGFLVGSADHLQLRHPLVGSVLYDDLSSDDTRQLHTRLAEVAASCEERARHRACATIGTDPEVAQALEEAAAEARDRGAVASAAELMASAVSLTPPDDTSDVVRRALAAGLDDFRAGQGDRARGRWRQLVSDLPAGPDRARALWHLAHYTGEGGVGEAEHLLLQARAEAGDDVTLLATIVSTMVRVAWWEGELHTARALASEALALAEESSDATMRAHVLGFSTLVEFHLGEPGWEELHRRAQDLEREHGDKLPVELLPSVWRGSVTLMVGDDLAAVRNDYLEARAVVDQRGSEETLGHIAATLCEISLRRGETDAARHHAQEAASIIADAEADRLHGWAQCCLAGVALYGGDPEAARRLALGALEHNTERRHKVITVFDRTLLALIEMTVDRPEAALGWIEPMYDTLRRQGFAQPGMYRFAADHIEALVAVGRVHDAEVVNRIYAEAAETFGRLDARAAALRGRALIAADRGDLDHAADAARESAEGYDRLERPFEQARSLLVLGRIELRRGHQSTADAALGRAGQLFSAVGATQWVDQTRTDPRVNVLGRFEVLVAGQVVAIPPGKPAQIVKMLACRGGRLHTEVVIDSLWPEAHPTAGRKALRNALTRLRTTAADLVVRDGESLTFGPAVSVDAEEFEAAAEVVAGPARSGDLPAAAREVLARYAGPLLPDDVYEAWADAPRERLRLRHLELLDLLADSAEREGDVGETVRVLERAIDADPMNEARYYRSAALLLAHGDRLGALGMLRRGEQVVEQLGLDPPAAYSDLTAKLMN